MYIFFFFQAEEGIRDYKVTGVQTCALPISARAPACLHARPQRGGRRRGGRSRLARPPGHRRARERPGRSEERRVGKESRGRGWGKNSRKKKEENKRQDERRARRVTREHTNA